MLKLCQLIAARSLLCVTSVFAPVRLTEAWPPTTCSPTGAAQTGALAANTYATASAIGLTAQPGHATAFDGTTMDMGISCE